MILFLYLVGFSFFVSVVFAVINDGDLRTNFFYGLKIFFQFVIISLVLAFVLYFLPF